MIASPYMEGGASVKVPRPLAVRSQAANKFLNFTSYHDVKTLTGMVRAYDGPFIRSLSLKAEGPDVMVEIIYKAQIFVPAADELVVEPGLFDDSAAAPRSPEPYEETRFRGAEQRVDA